MFKKLLCKLGFHKPSKHHYIGKYPIRTTNKGRSKKRYHTIKVSINETVCEVCGKVLKRKSKIYW